MRRRRGLRGIDRLEVAARIVSQLHDEAGTRDVQSWFRAVPQDYFDRFDGETEAPTGWFGLLRIDHDFRMTWMQEEYSEPVPDVINDGLYLVVIDSDGLVWALTNDNQRVVLNAMGEKVNAYGAYLRAVCESG